MAAAVVTLVAASAKNARVSPAPHSTVTGDMNATFPTLPTAASCTEPLAPGTTAPLWRMANSTAPAAVATGVALKNTLYRPGFLIRMTPAPGEDKAQLLEMVALSKTTLPPSATICAVALS